MLFLQMSDVRFQPSFINGAELLHSPKQQVRFFLVRINHGMMVQCEGHSIPLKNGKFF